MKRANISGFTVRVGGYWFEVVTVYHFPVSLTIYKNGNRDLVRRMEL